MRRQIRTTYQALWRAWLLGAAEGLALAGGLIALYLLSVVYVWAAFHWGQLAALGALTVCGVLLVLTRRTIARLFGFVKGMIASGTGRRADTLSVNDALLLLRRRRGLRVGQEFLRRLLKFLQNTTLLASRVYRRLKFLAQFREPLQPLLIGQLLAEVVLQRHCWCPALHDWC
jgi:hypothetical protein